MGLPILFIHTAAFRTGPGRIPGIDDEHFDALHQRLVGHKGAELIEGPVVQPVSLAFSGRNLFPDARKILNGNTGTSAFGLGNKLFGYVVVDPCLKTMLFSGDLFQSPFAGLRLFLLKAFSSFLIPDPFVFDRRAGEDFPIGIGGDVDDSKVYSKNLFRKFRLLFRNVADEIDKPFLAVFVKDKIDFPFSETEIFPLMLSADKWDLHSTGKSPKTDLVSLLEGKNPVVIGLRRPLTKNMDGGSIRPVRIGNLGNAPDDHLRGKFGRLPCFVVFGFMERELIEIFRIERMAGKLIAKTIAGFQRLEESLRLFFSRFQFEVDRYFHKLYSKLEF